MHAPHETVEHTHANILLRALECQPSWVGTYGDIVNHQFNLAYASK